MTRTQKTLTVSLTLTMGLLLLGLQSATSSAAPSRVLLPPHNPANNFKPPSLVNYLTDINAARAVEEGLGPIRLNLTKFYKLSIPERVFVMFNLERVSRGLPAIYAMTYPLDRVAQIGANRNEDPPLEDQLPPAHPTTTTTSPSGQIPEPDVMDLTAPISSIWSGTGVNSSQSAFEAIFGWVYADGCGVNYYGSVNGDCRANRAASWGHRDAILSDYGFAAPCSGPPLVGIAWNPEAYDHMPSVAAIFAEGCGEPYSPSYTWSQAEAFLGIHTPTTTTSTITTSTTTTTTLAS